jgi:hypothetical protein
MQINYTRIALSLLAIAALAAAGRPVPQDTNSETMLASSNDRSGMAMGEIVAEIDPSYGGVFQDQDHNYWFSGGNQGVFRHDGKPGGTITRFTTKDGLGPHRRVRNSFSPAMSCLMAPGDWPCARPRRGRRRR